MKAITDIYNLYMVIMYIYIIVYIYIIKNVHMIHNKKIRQLCPTHKTWKDKETKKLPKETL